VPAKVKTRRVKPSPALALIDRMQQTLQHRVVGCLVCDGVDKSLVEGLRKAATYEGAQFVVVAPKIGGVKTQQGDMLPADGQLAGTPSVLFDVVAVVLSKDGAASLSRDPAARDFVSDAHAHLKFIAFNAAATGLLESAGVAPGDCDQAVVEIASAKTAKDFMVQARKLRHWVREAALGG
jgi:catalase